MQLFAEVAVRPNRTVIVVTHDNRILEFADTITHMEDGRAVEVERKTNGLAGIAQASAAQPWMEQAL